MLKQSTTYSLMFFMVSSTDHLSAKTGAAPVVNISKAGAAFGAAAGAITEIGSGWYKAALTVADTNTLGDLAFHITGTGADDADLREQVFAKTVDDLMSTFTLPANFSALSISAGGLVDILQTAADKVWGTTVRALTDKVGFALSAAGVQAIWDALTSALTTVGSIGKLLVDNVNATISSRSTYAGADTAGTTTLLSRLTGTRATNLDNLDATITSRHASGAAVSSVGAVGAGGLTASSFGVGAIDALALDTTAVNEIADGLLDRNMATGTDSGSPTIRTVRQALRALRNKVGIAAGTLTVTKEDDTTASWTGAVTTAAGNPISEIDPA